MHLPLGQPGPSTWQLRSSSPLPPLPSDQLNPRDIIAISQQESQHPRLDRRGGYSRTAVFMNHSVINDDGSFNGSCAASQQDGTAIETPSGSCTSYYPDITVYCCSGVEGTVSTLPYQVTTSSSPSISTVQEPICRTSRYSDSLSCFKMTAEVHCRSGNSGLYGVCNPNGTDTSFVTNGGPSSRFLGDRDGLGWKGRAATAVVIMAVWTVFGAV